jgi:DNA-binding LytR/AlgR family response regulator
VRINRSVIINLAHVRQLDRRSLGNGTVSLAQGSVLQVSRRRCAVVARCLGDRG